MQAIDRIVFNCLCSHRPVTIENGVTLSVVRVPARREGKATIASPTYEVTVRGGQQMDCSSIPEILTEEYGLEPQTAARAHARWLRDIKKGNSIFIEGCGEIAPEGKFNICEKLNNTLNPAKPYSVTIPRHGNKKRVIWSAVLVLSVLAGAGAGFYYLNDSDPTTSYVKDPAAHSAGQNAPESSPLPVDRETGEMDAESGQQAATERVDDLQVEALPSGPLFYVVAGIFSTPENAERYISELTRKYPGIPAERYGFTGNKYLVSIGIAEERVEASRMRNAFARQLRNDELWIHEAQKPLGR